MHPKMRRGFTLVEILVVVLILGILAAVAIPRFSDATSFTRDTSVQTTLQYLRGQIELFKTQHGNHPPANGFLWVLLQKTSDSTEIATSTPTGTHFGPYFRANPLNPWNNLTDVSSNTVDSSAGWYYSASGDQFELRIRNLDGSINRNY